MVGEPCCLFFGAPHAHDGEDVHAVNSGSRHAPVPHRAGGDGHADHAGRGVFRVHGYTERFEEPNGRVENVERVHSKSSVISPSACSYAGTIMSVAGLKYGCARCRLVPLST